MRDIIVHDEYMEELQTKVYDVCEDLNRALNKYIAIMEGVRDEGISQGETHEAVKTFVEKVSYLDERFKLVGGCFKLLAGGFVQAIDKADQYLY